MLKRCIFWNLSSSTYKEILCDYESPSLMLSSIFCFAESMLFYMLSAYSSSSSMGSGLLSLSCPWADCEKWRLVLNSRNCLSRCAPMPAAG